MINPPTWIDLTAASFYLKLNSITCFLPVTQKWKMVYKWIQGIREIGENVMTEVTNIGHLPWKWWGIKVRAPYMSITRRGIEDEWIACILSHNFRGQFQGVSKAKRPLFEVYIRAICNPQCPPLISNLGWERQRDLEHLSRRQREGILNVTALEAHRLQMGLPLYGS